MKSKKLISFVLTFSIVLLFSVSVFAMAGGIPAKHELPGEDFGAAVSAMAQSEPGAVAAHVANKPDLQNSFPEELEAEQSDMAGGMPAKHGLTGEEFGAKVSAMAQSEPGAVAAHVAKKPEMQIPAPEKLEADESEMAGGMPAKHGLTGEEFGAAVSVLAQSEPGAVAAHVAKKPEMQIPAPEKLEADESEMAGGIPAAHGITGDAFGAAVSVLANADPAALVDHVRGK